jgi:hypothetical protein
MRELKGREGGREGGEEGGSRQFLIQIESTLGREKREARKAQKREGHCMDTIARTKENQWSRNGRGRRGRKRTTSLSGGCTAAFSIFVPSYPAAGNQRESSSAQKVQA